ncbi:hypothetical protein BD779DRAFT_1679430 [Infundibulicybe gibba]|nr:hypothetical protein BD779DRAFT_1679430 [Infundibulicybe gibba]
MLGRPVRPPAPLPHLMLTLAVVSIQRPTASQGHFENLNARLQSMLTADNKAKKPHTRAWKTIDHLTPPHSSSSSNGLGSYALPYPIPTLTQQPHPSNHVNSGRLKPLVGTTVATGTLLHAEARGQVFTTRAACPHSTRAQCTVHAWSGRPAPRHFLKPTHYTLCDSQCTPRSGLARCLTKLSLHSSHEANLKLDPGTRTTLTNLRNQLRWTHPPIVASHTGVGVLTLESGALHFPPLAYHPYACLYLTQWR